MQNPSKRSMSESSLKLADQSTKGTKAVRSACLQKETPSEKDTQGQIAIKHLQDDQDIFGSRKSEIEVFLKKIPDLEKRYEEKRRKLLDFIEDQKDKDKRSSYIKDYDQVLNMLDKIYWQHDRMAEKFRKEYGRLHSHNQDYFCPYQRNTMTMAKNQLGTRPQKKPLGTGFD